jgi:hypothetical protein
MDGTGERSDEPRQLLVARAIVRGPGATWLSSTYSALLSSAVLGAGCMAVVERITAFWTLVDPKLTG